MTVLLHAHSGFRYVVLLLGVATVAHAVYLAVARRPWSRGLGRLGAAFAASFHVQILLGVGLLFTGTYGAGVAGHFLIMAFSAACAQIVPSVTRRRPADRRSPLPYAVGAIVALALAVAGIMAIGRPVLG